MRKNLHGFVHTLFSLIVFFVAGAAVALTVDAVQASAAVEDWGTPVVQKQIDPYWEVDFSGERIPTHNLKNTFTVGPTKTVDYFMSDPVGLAWQNMVDPGELFWDDALQEYRIGTR